MFPDRESLMGCEPEGNPNIVHHIDPRCVNSVVLKQWLMGVVRESFEETGLSVEPGELVELVERIVPDDQGRFRYHYVIADFLCRVSGGGLRAGSDAPDAKWVPREQLEAMGLADITLKVVRTAFERSRV